MKLYTVTEVAEMLNVNPETVRRWIRNDGLRATLSSRKEGSRISEDDLQRFLDSSPRLSKLATIFRGRQFVDEFLKEYGDKPVSELKTSNDPMKQLIAEHIRSLKERISEKEIELSALRRDLAGYEALLIGLEKADTENHEEV